MSAISLKSITGITSITTPSGVDNQLTLHTNNTTEAVKLDTAGNLHFHNHLNITGISTAANFKTGTSNLHSTGLNVQDLDVDGHTNLDNVSIAGVTTMTGNLAMGESLTLTGGVPHVNFIDNGANPDWQIGNINGILRFQDTTAGQERIVINSNGNVSIYNDLDVDGHTNLDNVSIAGVVTATSLAATGAITATGTIETTGSELKITGAEPRLTFTDTDNNPDFQIWANAQRFSIYDSTNSATRLRINSGGEVLIGTETGTGNNLTVQDAGTSTTAGGNIVARFQSNGSGRDASIQLSDNVAHSALISMVSSNFAINLSGNERFRIASGGQVIIGDDDIDKANGHFDDLIVGANASTTETHGITIVCGNAATNGGIAFSDGSAGGADAYRGMISYQHNDNHMHFRTNAVERLRLESDGDVNIMTNNVSLRGAGTLRINSGSTSGTLNLDGGSTNHGGEINLTGGSNGGRIQFRTGQGAGQQGEKMRLDENGRLLIGGTSSDYAFSGGDDLIIGNTNSGTRSGITLVSNSANDGGLYFSDGTSSGSAYVQGQIVYDHSNHYLRFYTSSDEKFRIFGGTTEHVLQMRGGVQLSISDFAATQSFSGSYAGFHADNHGNIVIGLNAHLDYGGGSSGVHKWKQTNAHSSIGSAGMFIGGNGSDNNSDICFFANPQGSNAGASFAQNSWKFRISNSSAGNTDITQNYNLRYLQRGYFKCDTSAQNASNFPLAAGSGIGGYSFGYQEAFSTSNGSWVYPYPDLVLGYHTGMRFGAHRNYNGCRFYQDHPYSNTNIVLSIGNGSTGVHVTNSFTAGSNKGFRIAHPHPSKKYTHDLVHNAIEAPQMDLIYRGKVDLVGGSATVNIDTKANMTDGTFVLLNRDVQCFTSNETGWTAVKGSVSGNILTITAQDNSCTDTISWMVVGERQDDKIKQSELTTADGDLITEPLTIEETHM